MEYNNQVKNESHNRRKRRRDIGIAVGLIVLLITIVGVTYAAFQYTKKGSEENEITTGAISFKYTETENSISIEEAYPMSDTEGKQIKAQDSDNGVTQGYFDFTVEANMTGSMTIPYYIYAVDITQPTEEVTKIDPKYVKLYLTEIESEGSTGEETTIEGFNGEEVPTYTKLKNISAKDEQGSPVTGKKLYSDQFTESGAKHFRLRMWVSERYPVNKAQQFSVKVNVNTEATETDPGKDSEKPTCEITNTEPESPGLNDEINMSISCTDNTGYVKSDLTVDDIIVQVGGEDVSPTTKELTEKPKTISTTSESGIDYNLKLQGFTKGGALGIKIPADKLTDEDGNTNEELILTPEPSVIISKKITVQLEKGEGVSSIGEEGPLSCNETIDGSGCSITLPEITPKEGYTGAYWTTGADEIQPGQVTVTGPTTYTAKAKDTEAPVCELESLNPESPGTIDQETGEVTMDIICTDNSGEIKQGPQTTSFKVTYGGTDGTATIEANGDATPANKDEKQGMKYSFKIKEFSGTGEMALTLKENEVQDNAGNGNIDTPITTGYTIQGKGSTAEQFITQKSNASGATYDTGDKNKMFEFKHESTDQVTEAVTDYRYVGENPNNYIDLLGGKAGNEDELWRIIGVTKEANAEGNSEYRLKLIRAKKIGDYSWDNVNEATYTSGSSQYYYGANSWERPSALKAVLNDEFYNGTSGQCPYCAQSGTFCQNSPTTPCDFSENGLSSVKNKIENMTWYLGGGNSYSGAEGTYKMERNSSTLGGYSGSKASGTGHVGLMYPSDYGFGYGAGFGKTTCYESNLGSCNSETTKNWLLDTSVNTWTITPRSGNAYNVWCVGSNGFVNGSVYYGTSALYQHGVRPVVYLKSDISITEATGSVSDPFTLSG